ncbi:hypothetical protein AMTRI_Chr04g180330 [Amborella trichopoda]|uniref:uncharacterized protein LOC18439409 isoform X2 n=1 Tax=Amborella trichopoda TaxID=13333 RepID=UPI0009BCA887|nr:uncharacterized protein LOC18439409 isoform X2 [Amborella trichopoda]|eukprot:XP_020526049.1 uncharacterized protein LOC18439409 isoform X2 [Amborella trichopoda]
MATIPSYASKLMHFSPFNPSNKAGLTNRDFQTVNPFKHKEKPWQIQCSKKKTSFTDRILDYIEGGPKLRKWYGASDELPRDGGLPEEEESAEVRDSILVTNGDSEIGQMVILSLILRRARVKALVNDKRAALDAFGSYVEPISRQGNDSSGLTKAIKGVRAIICPSHEGCLSEIESMRGVQHIILLSQLAVYKSSSGIQGLMNNKARRLAERDEEAVQGCGIPYTIIQAGLLENSPGGMQGFSFEKDAAAKGRLSKEDAAMICAEALNIIPERGLVFEVVNGEEKVLNWKERFASLIASSEQLQK